MVTRSTKPAELTGRKFGRLKVLGKAPNVGGRTAWECECECGWTGVITTHDLRRTRSPRRECPDCARTKDVRGRRFGRLTAIRPAGKDGGCTMWLCECECGNETTVRLSSLLSGNTRSCGCLVHDCERPAASDVVDGTRLGMLGNETTRQNTSGVRGVSWDKQHRRWAAYIKFRGDYRHLGMYKTLEEAAEARREAEQELYDPVLEEHGEEPTSEETYRANLAAAMEKAGDGKKEEP